MSDIYSEARRFPCSFCGVDVGEHCRTPQGAWAGPHSPRLRAIDDEILSSLVPKWPGFGVGL